MSANLDQASRLLLELSDPKAERLPSVILGELVPAILAIADKLGGSMSKKCCVYTAGIERVVERLHATIEILAAQRRRDPPDPDVLGLLEDVLAMQMASLQEMLPDFEEAAA